MLETTIVRPAANGAGEVSTSGVTWSAIIAGAIAAAAIGLILLVLGMGLGLTAVSPWALSGVSGTTLGVGAVIWLVVTAVDLRRIGRYGQRPLSASSSGAMLTERDDLKHRGGHSGPGRRIKGKA